MSDDELKLIPTTDDLKQMIKKNKSIVLPLLMVVVLLALIGPYLWMVQQGYSMTTIGYYYIAGIVVIFFLLKTIQSSMKSSKVAAKPKESVQDRKARIHKELDEIEKSLDDEAEIHRKRLAEIEAEKKGK